jgi:hypothetical protein
MSPCSPVFEHGGSFRKTLMIDLSLSSMRKTSSLTLLVTRSSPRNFLVTSTATSSGHLVMARSLSSMTPMKKRRHWMRRRSALNSWLLLLLPTWRQLPVSLLTMPLRERKMIIVMIKSPFRRLAAAMATEVASVCVRLLRRRPRC